MYVALNFSRILDKTYDGKTLKDKYLCLITYTLYGLIFWNMPQFSGFLPVHLEYMVYIKALDNHVIGANRCSEYINKCMKVWKNILPIYIIFDELGFEPLFEMPLNDVSPDNFGNHFLIKAVACSNGDVNKVIPFLIKNNPELEEKIRRDTNIISQCLRGNTYITPPLLTKEELGQMTCLINDPGMFHDNALAHSIILGYDDVCVLLIVCGANPCKLVSFDCGLGAWTNVTKNKRIENFIRYATDEYYEYD
jgi:hypothetical protein